MIVPEIGGFSCGKPFDRSFLTSLLLTTVLREIIAGRRKPLAGTAR
jgi:hypothetical protein